MFLVVYVLSMNNDRFSPAVADVHFSNTIRNSEVLRQGSCRYTKLQYCYSSYIHGARLASIAWTHLLC